MKRLVLLLLLLAILLAACSREDTIDEGVSFYYVRSEIAYSQEDSLIACEKRDVGREQTLLSLLTLYFRGPMSDALKQPFPAGLTVLNATYADSVLKITLSDEISMLTGIDLTVACACITRTCTELSGAGSVIITTQDGSFSLETSLDQIQFSEEVPTIPLSQGD